MARVLAAAGAEVTREFYVNDRGVQMDQFGASLVAAAAGEPVPEDGYHGRLHRRPRRSEIVAEHPRVLDAPRRRADGGLPRGRLRPAARGSSRTCWTSFRTHFDVWYSERALHESGAVERGMAKLREQGHVFEADGAVWLRTTDFGDDKDRVLVKADGELTYFAVDTAYYVDKRDRGLRRLHLPARAPTTTATSTGCGRWPRAPATTRTATSRC